MSDKLTSAELHQLKNELEAMRHRARQEVQDGVQYMQTQLEQINEEQRGWSDAAEMGQRKEIRAAEIEIDQATVAAVNLALQRMADGRYGICLDCDQPILFARLKAQPTAIRCAACQGEYEKQR